MGHEFVGEVVAVGADVISVIEGDRVCAPFTTNCGNCFYCHCGMTSRCLQGQLFGWRESGVGLHGGQSQFVRVPLADSTLVKIPDQIASETALLLGDNLSTAYFAADMLSMDPDGVYAVVGCGTVGLLAIQSAMRRGTQRVFAIEPDERRRRIASKLGAYALKDAREAVKAIRDATDGRGADGVMELVGLPLAQRTAYELIRPGGTMSVIGCHCTPDFAFSPVDAYNKNLTYRTGRCPARHYMTKLLPQLLDNPIDLSWCITHRYSIDQAEQAYDTFANRKDGCVKAVILF
jgi:threonine dehydrogenase-like Zn-dependent dehydrogenase